MKPYIESDAIIFHRTVDFLPVFQTRNVRHLSNLLAQDNPPAWPQEAYQPRSSFLETDSPVACSPPPPRFRVSPHKVTKGSLNLIMCATSVKDHLIQWKYATEVSYSVLKILKESSYWSHFQRFNVLQWSKGTSWKQECLRAFYRTENMGREMKIKCKDEMTRQTTRYDGIQKCIKPNLHRHRTSFRWGEGKKKKVAQNVSYLVEDILKTSNAYQHLSR